MYPQVDMIVGMLAPCGNHLAKQEEGIEDPFSCVGFPRVFQSDEPTTSGDVNTFLSTDTFIRC
jgi:hypothetical protein